MNLASLPTQLFGGVASTWTGIQAAEAALGQAQEPVSLAQAHGSQVLKDRALKGQALKGRVLKGLALKEEEDLQSQKLCLILTQGLLGIDLVLLVEGDLLAEYRRGEGAEATGGPL